mmetsp:Transcript_125194/g.286868  ORF Transcript_125194/g.286868 Transcript_125194/m.286868 type:complete len:252 (-) Transcript_125194:959-1714(-)
MGWRDGWTLRWRRRQSGWLSICGRPPKRTQPSWRWSIGSRRPPWLWSSALEVRALQAAKLLFRTPVRRHRPLPSFRSRPPGSRSRWSRRLRPVFRRPARRQRARKQSWLMKRWPKCRCSRSGRSYSCRRRPKHGPGRPPSRYLICKDKWRCSSCDFSMHPSLPWAVGQTRELGTSRQARTGRRWRPRAGRRWRRHTRRRRRARTARQRTGRWRQRPTRTARHRAAWSAGWQRRRRTARRRPWRTRARTTIL